MKQFNLKEYLENPSRKVVTRDGKPARIICIDAKREYLGEGPHPVIALVEEKKNQETIYNYGEDGIFREGYKYSHDLFFAPVKKEGWVNIYDTRINGKMYTGSVFDTKEEAVKNIGLTDTRCFTLVPDYISTVHIEWEEDE